MPKPKPLETTKERDEDLKVFYFRFHVRRKCKKCKKIRIIEFVKEEDDYVQRCQHCMTEKFVSRGFIESTMKKAWW